MAVAIPKEAPKPDEVACLVVSFLQGIYKDNPNGINVKEFTVKFPEICGEDSDWYKDYGYPSLKAALQAIEPEHVNLTHNKATNVWFVCLNPRSSKIDKDIMNLILGQRAKPKKRRNVQNRPNRALASFSMNRQWASKPSYNQSQYNNRRLNQERNDSFIYSKGPEPARPSLYNNNRHSYSNSNSGASPYDPRAGRSHSSVQNLSRPSPPPQGPLRSPTTPQPPNQTFRQSSQPVSWSGTLSNKETSRTSPPRQAQPSQPVVEPIVRRKDKDYTTTKTVEKIPDDEQTIIKKNYIRQRLVFLLTRKHSEIKLLHLKNLYQYEFEEDLNPGEFGFKSIADLMKDPLISSHIKLNVKSPSITISMRNSTPSNGKENVNTEATCAESNCNGLTKDQKKMDAIDPFNLQNMTNSLEQFIEPLKESTNSIENMATKCEDVVKYKILRIVFKSPSSLLPLDDWETKYEQETRLRIRARDFGYKTNLEFFKALQEDMPISVYYDDTNHYVATVVTEDLQNWVSGQLNRGYYKAMMSMDSLYEIVAMPDDLYTYNKLGDDLIEPNRQTSKEIKFHPVSILSAKDYESMWIRIKDAKNIESFLSIEASMTCYEDYKRKGLLKVPLQYVMPGFPCAVFDPAQRRWCRGMVLKSPETVDKNYMIEVLLVDYGITKQVAISEMLCILKNHQSCQVGPIYSRLLGVIDRGQQGKAHSRMVLQEYTNPPVKLACDFRRKIKLTDSMTKHMPRYIAEICLCDTRRNEDVIIADLINVDGDSPDANK